MSYRLAEVWFHGSYQSENVKLFDPYTGEFVEMEPQLNTIYIHERLGRNCMYKAVMRVRHVNGRVNIIVDLRPGSSKFASVEPYITFLYDDFMESALSGRKVDLYHNFHPDSLAILFAEDEV